MSAPFSSQDYARLNTWIFVLANPAPFGKSFGMDHLVDSDIVNQLDLK
jgi:hypothetical protein